MGSRQSRTTSQEDSHGGRDSMDRLESNDFGGRTSTFSLHNLNYTELIALMRSGQIRFVSSEAEWGIGGSQDSENEDDFIEFHPEADANPDTTAMDASDLKQQMLFKQCGSGTGSSVLSMLYKRESGNCFSGKFSVKERADISQTFLPNKMNVVAQYGQKMFCGLYSQTGSVFLSACQDQTLRIFDTTNGHFRIMKTIHARDVGWSILDTAFSPDGNYLIYSSWSEFIHMCNVHGDFQTHNSLSLEPGNHHFCPFSVQFSSSNNDILAGANDGYLYIYDLEENKRTMKIDAHEDDVNSVRFADTSSQLLFSGGDDGLCKVWDRRTLGDNHCSPVGIMAGHTDGITCVDSKGDGRYFISNSKDQSIKLWDLRVISSSSAVDCCRRAVARQQWDYRWEQAPRRSKRRNYIKEDTSVMTYRGHGVLSTCIRCHFSPLFSTGQKYIYTGCASGSVIVYDVLTGRIVKNLAGHTKCVRDVSWHPSDNNIVSTSWDGSHRMWQFKSEDSSFDCTYIDYLHNTCQRAEMPT